MWWWRVNKKMHWPFYQSVFPQCRYRRCRYVAQPAAWDWRRCRTLPPTPPPAPASLPWIAASPPSTWGPASLATSPQQWHRQPGNKPTPLTLTAWQQTHTADTDTSDSLATSLRHWPPGNKPTLLTLTAWQQAHTADTDRLATSPHSWHWQPGNKPTPLTLTAWQLAHTADTDILATSPHRWHRQPGNNLNKPTLLTLTAWQQAHITDTDSLATSPHSWHWQPVCVFAYMHALMHTCVRSRVCVCVCVCVHVILCCYNLFLAIIVIC